ncbi:hypothetical protein DL96DRAFT_1716197 [Flagelloscypha sp. PMI_526]|nr:hypothetical protein DL96DRAFT_1716197 [Flagelloscypha sp. PMI_526]
MDFGLILFETVLLGFGREVGPFSALVAINISERILLSLLLAFRIWDVVQCGSRAHEPFNLVPSYDKGSSRMALLLGRNAWENLSLRGEPVIVKSLRGILAIAALAGLVTFSAILISRDMTSSQNEVTLKPFMLNDPKQLGVFLNWYYVVITPIKTHDNVNKGGLTVFRDNRLEFIKVTQICSKDNIAYNCTLPFSVDGRPIGNFPRHSSWNCSFWFEDIFEACQVQVQVDFERGVQIGAFDGPDYDHGVYVSIADGQIDANTINRIPKAALRRNQALQGDAVFYQHEFVSKSTLNSFGFTSSIQTTVGEIKYLSQDPLYTVPSNISYLKYRYSPLDDLIETGVREYTDNTVLDALASIGGLWTFGNGFFALVFGGIRPLSRFGFVHLFIRGRLRRATRERYPNFHCEGGQPGEAEAGVVAFIRQHLLGVIEDEEEEEARKKRRVEWERQRDEMEPLSFEVSLPFRADYQHTGSTEYESLRQKDEEYSTA